MEIFKKTSEFKYIMWFEDEGKRSIKNAYGGIFSCYSKKGAFDNARSFANDNNKNVLVQRGYKIWRFKPNEEKIEIVQE